MVRKGIKKAILKWNGVQSVVYFWRFALPLANQWKGNEGYICCIVGKWMT